MSQIPIVPSPVSVVDVDRACVGCGYNLRALPVGSVCPECATPINQTLRGFVLRFASRTYLASLHQGVVLVLGAIALQLMFSVTAVIASAAIMFATGGPKTGMPTLQKLQIALGGVGILIYLVQCLGYWKFTEPDPGFAGAEQPNSARRVIRAMVGVLALTQVGSFALQAFGQAPAMGGVGTFSVAMAGVAILLGLAQLVCWVVEFFCVMRYVRWLARRIPDDQIFRRTKLFMWLLPLLWTVGWLALALGPIAALVLYWNMLNSVRKHLYGIRAAPAFRLAAGRTEQV